ncbi:SDR family NAD(P)-dependent oxidoreductase [Rubrolithibacter danxiaensis]|uniref:SDR family NAD(P)-dependent oxidoreductase n=1 Tax=Rubrolithibacter danxiaensis TaxID=3390805 RepID=UPI003BF837B0
METKGQTALITGATSGIGYELTKLFAQDKFNLILVARNEQRLNEIAAELKSTYQINVTVIPKDLANDSGALEVYEETKRQGLTVNILVNDAGVGERGKFTETDFQKELEIIHLNIISLTHLTKLFLKEMVSRNEGRILQLASVASYQPTPLLAVYAATKAYVLSLTDALIHELKDTGVTMTALIPAPTDTDFFNKAHAENTVAAHKADDPAMVAKEGYEALLKGEHHATASASVLAQVAMSTTLPNEAVSAMAEKYMKEDKK